MEISLISILYRRETASPENLKGKAIPELSLMKTQGSWGEIPDPYLSAYTLVTTAPRTKNCPMK